MPDKALTSEDLSAIATVVAHLARGRGKWFDAEATAVRFGRVAESNLGFRSQVMDTAAKVRANEPQHRVDLRRLERTADELITSMRKRAARARRRC